MQTRGIRNHNPLNIRKGCNWLGEATNPTDTAFEVFQADVYGLRAAFCIVRTYIKKHHCNTLRKIITRWAPPQDHNDTAAYIATVTEHSGINPDITLAFEDSTRICALIKAMCLVESQYTPSDRLLSTAYYMV